MSAGRALLRAVGRRRSDEAGGPPPVFWGRVGEYEAVCRQGILLLLSPEPVHPSQRATPPVPATARTRLVS